MRTLQCTLFILICACLLTGCSKELTSDYDMSDSPELKSRNLINPPLVTGLDQERFVTMKEIPLQVHYRIIGKGPVDMVFIAGWTNPLTAFTKQFDYFRDKARCIYIDLPGHGLSDSPEGIEYSMGLMADAIYDVLKKEGVKNFIAVGFSWGGTPFTQFEIRHPGMIEQLILLDVGITTWPPMTQASLEATYNVHLNLTPEAKLAALNGLIPQATAPEDLKEWGLYFLDFPNWLMANLYYNFSVQEVCQPYPWDIPILVIYRGMAPGSPKETRTKLYFPGCQIVVIGGDQHVIQWAYHETVNQLMDDFMEDRPGKKY